MRHRSPTYQSWRAMRQRCLSPNAKDYPAYGGAGVIVDARWGRFATFLADMGERPPATTLDRLNGTRGYTPGNCRWATVAEQNRNRRDNTRLTCQGTTLCLTDWAKRTGLSTERILGRLKSGWSVERALTDLRDCRCSKSTLSSVP